MAYGDLTATLLRLAARPTGVTTRAPDFAEYTAVQVGSMAGKLVAAGRLFRVKTSHKSVTFFADKADAERMQSDRAFRRRPPAPVAKLPGAAHFAGDMIITPQTKITICPGWTPRYQASEIAGVYGGNQRGRVTVDQVVGGEA